MVSLTKAENSNHLAHPKGKKVYLSLTFLSTTKMDKIVWNIAEIVSLKGVVFGTILLLKTNTFI